MSEVGSIPTRSRHLGIGGSGARAGRAALLVLFAAVTAFIGGTARADDAHLAPPTAEEMVAEADVGDVDVGEAGVGAVDVSEAGVDAVDIGEADLGEAEVAETGVDTTAAGGDEIAPAGALDEESVEPREGNRAEGRVLEGEKPSAPGAAPSEPATATQGAAAADTTAWHRKPVATMFKSVLFPGWGQWSNGKHLKAGAFLLTEGYFVYRAVRAARNEWDAEDLGQDGVAQSWNEERRDYTWWLLFTVVLSMGDAYVDAHLKGFDLEFEPEGQGGRAAIQWTF